MENNENESNENRHKELRPPIFSLALVVILIIVMNKGIKAFVNDTKDIEDAIKSSYNFTDKRDKLLFDVRYKKFSTKEGITYMVSAEPVEKGYSRYKFTRRLSEAQFDKIIGLSNNGVWLTVEECEIIFNDGERTYTARFHDYQELDGYVNKDDDYKLDIRNKMIEYLTKNNRNDNLSKINELLQDDYPGIKFDSYEFVIPSSANIKNVVTETNKS